MVQKHIAENKNKPYVVMFQAINAETLQLYLQESIENNLSIT